MSWQSGEVLSDWIKKSIASIFQKGEKRTPGITDLLASPLLWEDHEAMLLETVLTVLGGPGGDSRQPAWLHQGQPA